MIKKRFLLAAITIVPKRIQQKALVKALSFVLPDTSILTGVKGLTLSIPDLNKSWTFGVSEDGFNSVVPSSLQGELIELTADSQTLFKCQRKSRLVTSLTDGSVVISASNEKKQQMLTLLASIEQHQLDALVNRCYSFLHIKSQPYLDVNTVTIEDVEHDEDIDYLRDEAIRLEDIDLKLALKVMRVAQQARPKGPLINSKVAQYEQQLEGLSCEAKQ